jgi:hypothetical protein
MIHCILGKIWWMHSVEVLTNKHWPYQLCSWTTLKQLSRSLCSHWSLFVWNITYVDDEYVFLVSYYMIHAQHGLFSWWGTLHLNHPLFRIKSPCLRAIQWPWLPLWIWGSSIWSVNVGPHSTCSKSARKAKSAYNVWTSNRRAYHLHSSKPTWIWGKARN